MGNNYTWVKVKITTENRDRPGGHDHSYAHDSMGYCEPYSPAGARFLKRKTRREQRRQHAKIIRVALREYEEDFFFYNDLHNSMIMDDYDYDYMEDNYDDYDDYRNDRYEDDYDDIIYYDDYCFMDDYYPSRSYVREETPDDRIIKYEDAGKTLGELLEEIQQRKNQG